jgi:hypothetical protein
MLINSRTPKQCGDDIRPSASHSDSTASSFLIGSDSGKGPSNGRLLLRTPRRASVSESDEKVDRLLQLLGVNENSNNIDDQEVQNIILSLERMSPDDTSFPSILGNYNVTHVIPSKPSEKPVGGKWSRGPAQALLKTRRTLQHLLPPKAKDSVAEAVNVISLSALKDMFRIHVILRGDAYALTETERSDIVQKRQTPGGLSARTVRADFDPPRIVVGRVLNLSIGPTSSVVLDTPFCDDRIRLGKGSRGSWFVFKRCFDDEADEWKELITQRPLRKSRAFAVLTGCLGVGAVACRSKGIARVVGAALSVASLLSAILIGFSSGGIERDDSPSVQATAP